MTTTVAYMVISTAVNSYLKEVFSDNLLTKELRYAKADELYEAMEVFEKCLTAYQRSK